jgi:hypothetical protein
MPASRASTKPGAALSTCRPSNASAPSPTSLPPVSPASSPSECSMTAAGSVPSAASPRALSATPPPKRPPAPAVASASPAAIRTPTPPPPRKRWDAGFVIVGRDYFSTVGLSLLKGRDFDRLEEQGASAAPVAIVDELLARRLWGDLDPLGRQFETVERDRDGRPRTFEVIGVAAGVRQEINDAGIGARFYVRSGSTTNPGSISTSAFASPAPAPPPACCRASARASPDRRTACPCCPSIPCAASTIRASPCGASAPR